MQTSESILFHFSTEEFKKSLDLSRYLIKRMEAGTILESEGLPLLNKVMTILSDESYKDELHQLLTFTIKKGFDKWSHHLLDNYTFDFKGRTKIYRTSYGAEYPEVAAIGADNKTILSKMIDKGLDINLPIINDDKEVCIINLAFSNGYGQEKATPSMWDFLLSQGFILKSAAGDERCPYDHIHNNILSSVFKSIEMAKVSLAHNLLAKEYLATNEYYENDFYVSNIVRNLYNHFESETRKDSGFINEVAINFIKNIKQLNHDDVIYAPFYDVDHVSRIVHSIALNTHRNHSYDSRRKDAICMLLDFLGTFIEEPLILRKNKNIVSDLKKLTESVKLSDIGTYYIKKLSTSLIPEINTKTQFDFIIDEAGMTPLQAMPFLKEKSKLKSEVLADII